MRLLGNGVSRFIPWMITVLSLRSAGEREDKSKKRLDEEQVQEEIRLLARIEEG